ncbi:glucosidase 2 subunit beta-like [Rhopilema esculentum]|uniref:glucosidase 2 subunit beta-like n=1 Tax=Rhopilema esculentum TaxID=499914 RepID=UPI0031E042D4
MGSYCCIKVLFLFVFKLSLFQSVLSTQIRGVPTSKLSFYDPSKDFTCLDGTVTLPFSYVNDDYCDCPDGSDEPGTSACPNGRFTCKNLGHIQLELQSGRVNDGVCDCCDGTDEYDSDATCSNICQEAGKAEKERREKEKLVSQQGYEVRMEYAQKGKAKKESIENEQNDLKTKLSENKGKLEEMKAAKERAESFEKEAKEQQDKEFEELEKLRTAEENLKKSEDAFSKLDIDGNGMVSVSEFVSSTLTSDEATEEKIKEKFSGEEQIDKLKLYELWPTINDLFIEKPVEDIKNEQPKDEQAEVKEESEADERKVTDFPGEDHGEDDDHDDNDDDELGETTQPSPFPPPSEAEAKGESPKDKPEYSEETKRLISIADQARKEFSEIESEISSLESKISNNDKLLSIDFGPNNEFLALYGECFEYDDREYTYKLCPFNSATQSSKSGGSDTSLGSWGEWHGSPDLYTKMKYKDGLSCWNGPNRSADITVSCGAKNEIVSVSEPNRCEYVMEFKTPAICNDPAHEQHQHEEL